MEELNAMIDGELRVERELELRWHLDLCQPCTLATARIVALKQAVGRTAQCEVASPTLRRSVTNHAIVPHR